MMEGCNCGKVYEILEARLTKLGFEISKGENYDDIIDGLQNVHFVKIENIREDLLQFATAMEKAMADKDEEKGNPWQNTDISYLLEGFEEELEEFVEGRKNFNIMKMQNELVDIANYCMMIRARLGDENE